MSFPDKGFVAIDGGRRVEFEERVRALGIPCDVVMRASPDGISVVWGFSEEPMSSPDENVGKTEGGCLAEFEQCARALEVPYDFLEKRREESLWTDAETYCRFMNRVCRGGNAGSDGAPEGWARVTDQVLPINDHIGASMGLLRGSLEDGPIWAQYDEYRGWTHLAATSEATEIAMVVMTNGQNQSGLCERLATLVFGRTLPFFPWYVNPKDYVLVDGKPVRPDLRIGPYQQGRCAALAGVYRLCEVKVMPRQGYLPEMIHVSAGTGALCTHQPDFPRPSPCLMLGENRFISDYGIMEFSRATFSGAPTLNLGLAASYRRDQRQASSDAIA